MNACVTWTQPATFFDTLYYTTPKAISEYRIYHILPGRRKTSIPVSIASPFVEKMSM
jgi:hypothetical protein